MRVPVCQAVIVIYFANATVAVDSSHTTASSSASWSRFSPSSNFLNGHVSTMWFMVRRWPLSHVRHTNCPLLYFTLFSDQHSRLTAIFRTSVPSRINQNVMAKTFTKFVGLQNTWPDFKSMKFIWKITFSGCANNVRRNHHGGVIVG